MKYVYVTCFESQQKLIGGNWHYKIFGRIVLGSKIKCFLINMLTRIQLLGSEEEDNNDNFRENIFVDDEAKENGEDGGDDDDS